MPKFTQEPIAKSGPYLKAIPEATIKEYQKFIDQLEKGMAGVLEFGKDENLNLARRALQQAGAKGKKYVRVQKVRGEDNKLRFLRITKLEYDEARKIAEARGAKLKGKRRAKK